ncbi:MAG: hypothetical protein GC171_03285 [Terrimonas sp.]|nr:hypothetical protein [Terrimonas sp.]
MNDSATIDYAVVYRNKEIKQLKKRLKKTRYALLICALLILSAGFIFLYMHGRFSTTDLATYIVVALVFAFLGTNSRKKPLKSIMAGFILLFIFWIEDISLGNHEMMFRGTILKLFVLAILLLALKTAKEADIIKRDLHLA